MKKFIAILMTASIIAAPLAFADDQPSATDQDAAMQKMSTNDQAASNPAKTSKKKARCHHCHCHHSKHKQHTDAATKAQ